MNPQEEKTLQYRHPILLLLTDKELIEIAAATNSDYPGQNELAKEICRKVFHGSDPSLTRYVGLAGIVALELAIRLKERNEDVALFLID